MTKIVVTVECEPKSSQHLENITANLKTQVRTFISECFRDGGLDKPTITAEVQD